MAVSQYDKENLSASQQAQISAVTKAAQSGSVSWSTAHDAAEAIRASAGYSGGQYGNNYTKLDETTYRAESLPTYEAQTGAVNNVYNTAKKNVLASLESAYQNSKAEAEQSREKIPAVYQAQANTVAAEAEKNKQSFNESAAASGINSGAGSQAQLAQNTATQANLTSVRTAEANAINDAETTLNQLYSNYQNSISEAIANNEYERAAALLSEYQKEAESVVSVAQSQADENYRSYQSGVTASQTSQQETSSKAETLAAYGDFSGYAALGYSAADIKAMGEAWIAANPELAYNTGKITQAQYKAILAANAAAAAATSTAKSKSKSGSSASGSGGSNGNNKSAGTETPAKSTAPTKITDYAQLGSTARQLLSNMQRNSYRTGSSEGSNSNLVNSLESALQKGTITEAEAEYILDKIGA